MGMSASSKVGGLSGTAMAVHGNRALVVAVLDRATQAVLGAKRVPRQRRDILQGSCQAVSVPFAADEPSGDWWYSELVFRHLSALPCRNSSDIGTRGG